MSFIAGYLLGSDIVIRDRDPRIKKLELLSALWTFEIADGWNVRVKIASDVDNAQYFIFGKTHGGIIEYYSMWSIYFCVYLNEDFKFASCYTTFKTKYQENYQNSSVPDNLYSTKEIYDFRIESGEMNISLTNTDFLSLKVIGSFTSEWTPYSWTYEGDRIKGEPSFSTETFSYTKNDFGGSNYGGSFIINGGTDDFRQAVSGLYAACRSLVE